MIDPTVLRKAVLDSLFKDQEVPDRKPPADAVIVDGALGKMAFHSGRLETHPQEVADALRQLPDQFHEGKGSGWSFLNACMDKDGNQWGEHVNVNELMVLGLGLGLVRYCLPREMWLSLPGSMPYFSVNLNGKAA